MKEYQYQLDYFCFPKSKILTEKYLDNYWMREEDYRNKYLFLKEIIFNKYNPFSSTEVITKQFKIMYDNAGLIFTKEYFEIFKKLFQIVGDTYFIIIEDYDVNNPPHESGPFLRFKYPIDITWSELQQNTDIDILAEGISYELFQRPVRNYFVFGDSGKWARYIGNDYIETKEILGCSPEYFDIFYDSLKEYYNRDASI